MWMRLTLRNKRLLTSEILTACSRMHLTLLPNDFIKTRRIWTRRILHCKGSEETVLPLKAERSSIDSPLSPPIDERVFLKN